MGYDENGTVLYDTKNIEDVKVGDLVYSYDTLTGEVSQRKVLSTSTNTTNHVNQLTICNENGVEQTIETTDGHPFWVVTDNPDLSRAARGVINENGQTFFHDNLGVTENGYWVETKDLRIGDVFLGADGTLSTLVSKLRLEIEDGIAIFNFEVEGNHNYFILAKEYEYGATCVLVHNNSRIRHFTNRGGYEGIKREGVINPSRCDDPRGIYGEQGPPWAPTGPGYKGPQRFGLSDCHHYVEFDPPKGKIIIPDPKSDPTFNGVVIITESPLPLEGLNPKFVKPAWWKFW